MYSYKSTFVVILNTSDGLDALSKQFSNKMLNNKSIQFLLVDRSVCMDDELIAADNSIRNSDNIDYVRVPDNYTIAQCYNHVMDKIKGEYVCFTNQHVLYKNSFAKILTVALKSHKDVNLVFGNYRKYMPERKLKRPPSYGCTVVDANKTQKLLTFLPSVYVRTDFIGNLRFTDVCQEESATLFLMSLFKKDPKHLVFERVYCYHDPAYISLRSDMFYGSDNKDFYIRSLKESFLPFIRQYTDNGQKLPHWVERIVFYRLYFKFYSNFNHRHKFLLNDDEIQEFFSYASQVLQYLPDKLIWDNNKFEQFAPPMGLRNLFLYLKYNGDLNKLNRSFEIKGDKLFFNQCGLSYDLSAHYNLTVKAFNFRNGNLSIDLRFFTHMLYDYEPDTFVVELNGKQYPIIKNDIYSLDKVFSISIDKSYTFSVDLPLSEVLTDKARISFYITLNGKREKIALEFNRAPSKLNTYCPDSYWRLNDELTLVYEDKSLVVKALSEKELKSRERRYRLQAIKALNIVTIDKTTLIPNIKAMFALRKEYFKRKAEFEGRRIWIFFDKLYKAGDNGEYAFRHAMTRNDGIECYYVINKDSLDYPRLKEEFPDNLLIYDTLECQLYSLMAENIIATHPDIIEFCSINGKLATVVKDLYNPNLVCIAHGITIQKNADYQNRLYDNTMFYTTSSKYEVAHILNKSYNYREDEVALTGLARFDGLKNNDQKQILITPTWRRNLVGEGQRNSTREYSNAFKKTSYYKIYNSLINDERIIEVAKRTGYRIIFLLHPAMSAQMDDYDRNDYVELIQASGDLNYEKILTESSLMITDYSGIHYDFGYMRKPIIYYQPKEVPMRFEEGGMKFKTMGFGPVCTEYEEAVSLICEYMENECRMPLEFKERADDFFAFDDFNSSQRIYDSVLKWTNDKNSVNVG